MPSRVCVTGHVQGPVPRIEKSRASCSDGRFPPSLIHQVFINTIANKLCVYVFVLKIALKADGA